MRGLANTINRVKPYSLDLRAKIIDTHQEGVSIRKIAERLRVSRGMVWNLIKLKRERSIKPKPAKGGNLSQLEGKEPELVAMTRQYSDYTLREYCEY